MPHVCREAAPEPSAARILVVEDESLTRFAIAEELRERGVTVVEAASADEAWQYLSSGGSVHLVFTDHRMPGVMTGAQLAIRIRRRYPTLPVQVTSGHFDDKAWTEPVLLKPYDLLQIAADLVERATRHSRGEL